MSLNNELAKQRNRAAAERTLMAWIRTCLSLISFGFGLDKILGAINRSRLGESSHVDLSVRLLAMGFILTGIVAMAAATRQHQLDLRQIRRDDYVYVDQASIATATAGALIVIGAIALVMLLLGARAG
jgi:putative membrane protein